MWRIPRTLEILITQPNSASLVSKRNSTNMPFKMHIYITWVPRFPHVYCGQGKFTSRSLQNEKMYHSREFKNFPGFSLPTLNPKDALSPSYGPLTVLEAGIRELLVHGGDQHVHKSSQFNVVTHNRKWTH